MRLEIVGIEVMYADVAVLAATDVGAPVRRVGERVHRPEVTTNRAQLVIEAVVVEAHLSRSGMRVGEGGALRLRTAWATWVRVSASGMG